MRIRWGPESFDVHFILAITNKSSFSILSPGQSKKQKMKNEFFRCE